MSKTARSPEQQNQLVRLADLPDDQIHTADIAEAPAESWEEARRGLYRPIKKPVTLRLDADVVSWFKRTPKPPATRPKSTGCCASMWRKPRSSGRAPPPGSRRRRL